MLLEGFSYGRLTAKSIFCRAQPPKVKTAINLTSIRAGSNSVTNHLSVSHVTSAAVRKKLRLQCRQENFISHTAREILRLCLGSTLLIFGQDL